MADISIINELPLSLVELKKRMDNIEKKGYRGQRTRDYLNGIAKAKPKEAEEIAERIRKLDIPRIKDKHIAKLIDIMPKDKDSVKMILSGEIIILKEEEIQKILGAVNA
ncbi:hypothetical protein HZB88_03165 [archaeon]|nr:hypothetical protein [archaeon]